MEGIDNTEDTDGTQFICFLLIERPLIARV
jgi:hypothetical protein